MEEVLLQEILGVGIGFIIVGLFVAMVMCVHWGYFCRKDKAFSEPESEFVGDRDELESEANKI